MQMWQMTEQLRRLSKCGGITDGIWLEWRLVSGLTPEYLIGYCHKNRQQRILRLLSKVRYFEHAGT